MAGVPKRLVRGEIGPALRVCLQEAQTAVDGKLVWSHTRRGHLGSDAALGRSASFARRAGCSTLGGGCDV